MPEQMRPASKKGAPNPAHTYERADPNREAGMGRLDTDPDAAPSDAPDGIEQSVKQRQDGTRQINAHDAVNQRGGPVGTDKAAKRQGDKAT
jgi:hypothetical protein